MRDEVLFRAEQVIQDYLTRFGYADHFIIKQIILENAMGQHSESAWLERGWNKTYNIIQFWDTEDVPPDVRNSIDRNKEFFPAGCHKLYNLSTAKAFVAEHFSERPIRAFEQCKHPAMQSDFFRLAYLYLNGGLYIDADMEVYAGFNESLFAHRDQITLSIAARRANEKPGGGWHWYSLPEVLAGATDRDTVFYFHNDIIAVTPFNEVVRIALIRAILMIEKAAAEGARLRAHTATGPTNISSASVIHMIQSGIGRDISSRFVLFDRSLCTQGNMYEYKSDGRNWMIADA